MELEYLTRVERSIPDGMGGSIIYYNNLYTYLGGLNRIVGRTDDNQYAIYEWYAVEIDPQTGSEIVYSADSIATTGPTTGDPVGFIDDTQNFFGGVIAKVSLVVTTSPGSEVTV